MTTHYADGPDNIDRFRNAHDMGAHDDFDLDELAALLLSKMHENGFPVRDYDGPRVLRDESLQTREVRPTGFIASQVAVSSAVPVSIAYARRERLAVQVTNVGTVTVYLGQTQANAQPTNGYPLAAGATVTIRALCDVWASVVAGGSATVGILDEFRSESDGA